MFYAEMQTAHYTFRALGPTRREALDAIRKGIRKHSAETGAGLMDYVGKGDENGDINVLEMTPMAAYCDYSEL